MILKILLPHIIPFKIIWIICIQDVLYSVVFMNSVSDVAGSCVFAQKGTINQYVGGLLNSIMKCLLQLLLLRFFERGQRVAICRKMKHATKTKKSDLYKTNISNQHAQSCYGQHHDDFFPPRRLCCRAHSAAHEAMSFYQNQRGIVQRIYNLNTSLPIGMKSLTCKN